MKSSQTASTGILVVAMLGLALAGCGESGSSDDHSHGPDHNEHAAGTHVHDDGSMHADHADEHDEDHMGEEEHAHDEVPLDAAMIGGLTVQLAQGHGAVEPGKESHLVVKLPYSDNGATIVRAWIGTEDRTLSFVGKGEYAPSHDDYDIHAMAPDPLPENTMWWIEVEKPDGTKGVGSAKPIME